MGRRASQLRFLRIRVIERLIWLAHRILLRIAPVLGLAFSVVGPVFESLLRADPAQGAANLARNLSRGLGEPVTVEGANRYWRTLRLDSLLLQMASDRGEWYVRIAPARIPLDWQDLELILSLADGDRPLKRTPFTSSRDVAARLRPRLTRVRELLSEANYGAVKGAILKFRG